MAVKVFSFQEVSVTLSHPSLGVLPSNSSGGIGTIKVGMATDRTDKQVGSDGVVVLSKIRDRSGSFSISIFNTCDMHKGLKKWFNYLEQADASEWGLISTTLTSKSTNEAYKLTGVAFTKLPDGEYATTANQITWDFIVADVQQDVI